MSSSELELGENEFPCGHLCQDNNLMIYLTAATSVILLGYAAFLHKRRSRDRVFLIIRALITVFLVVRVFSVVVPATVPFVATFVSLRQMSLFLSVFMWHKSVVDSSWKAVKVSLTSPKWVQYFTWIQMAIIVLVFPITYGLGAHPLGNPRCSTVQAVNSAYRFFMSICLAASMGYANFVIHRVVRQLRSQNTGSNEGLQRRMKNALHKIRKVSAFLFIVVVVLTYTFFNGIIGEGAPFVTCNGTFGDVFGSISSGLGAYVMLYSTDSSNGPNGSSSGTKSISSSNDQTKSKNYSEMQSSGGFSSPKSVSPQGGGFSSPRSVSPQLSPRSVSPRNGGFTAHAVSLPLSNTPSPQTSPRNGGFTAGPSTGFVSQPSRPSSRASTPYAGSVASTGVTSHGPFAQQPPPMRPEEVI